MATVKQINEAPLKQPKIQRSTLTEDDVKNLLQGVDLSKVPDVGNMIPEMNEQWTPSAADNAVGLPNAPAGNPELQAPNPYGGITDYAKELPKLPLAGVSTVTNSLGNVWDRAVGNDQNSPNILDRVLNGLKENMAMAPVGPGANIISKILFGDRGDIYAQGQPQGKMSGATVPAEEDPKYFSQTSMNTSPQGNNGGVGSNVGDLSAQWASSPNGRMEQYLMRMNTPQSRQQLAQIQALKKSFMETQSAGQTALKGQRERTQDIGNYTQGSPEYKQLQDNSMALKKIDTFEQKMLQAIKTNDVATLGSLQSLAEGMLKWSEGMSGVSDEQRQLLNTFTKDAKGFFGLGAGQVYHPENVEAMLRTLDSIRSGSKENIDNLLSSPQVGEVNPDTISHLYNRVPKTEEKAFTNAKLSIEKGPNDEPLAEAFTVTKNGDIERVYVDKNGTSYVKTEDGSLRQYDTPYVFNYAKPDEEVLRVKQPLGSEAQHEILFSALNKNKGMNLSPVEINEDEMLNKAGKMYEKQGAGQAALVAGTLKGAGTQVGKEFHDLFLGGPSTPTKPIKAKNGGVRE